MASFEQSRLNRPLARLSGALAMYDYAGYRRALEGETEAVVSFASTNVTQDAARAQALLANGLYGKLQRAVLDSGGSGGQALDPNATAASRASGVGWDILGTPTSSAIAPVGQHRQTLLVSREDPTAQFLVIGVHNARDAKADAAVDLSLMAIADESFDLASAARTQAQRLAAREAAESQEAGARRVQGSSVDFTGTDLESVDRLCDLQEAAANASTAVGVDGGGDEAAETGAAVGSPLLRSPAIDFCTARRCGGSGTLVNASGSLQCQCLPGWGSDDALCSSPRFQDFSRLVDAAQSLDFLCSICDQKQYMNEGDLVLVKVQQPLQNGRALRLKVGHPLDVNVSTNASDMMCADAPAFIDNGQGAGGADDGDDAVVIGLPGTGVGGGGGAAVDPNDLRAVPALLVATVLPRQVADFAAIQASADGQASLLVTERSQTGSYWAAVYAQRPGCVQLAASREDLETSTFPTTSFWGELSDWLFGTRTGLIALIVTGTLVALVIVGCALQNCCTTHHDPHSKMRKHAQRTRQMMMAQFASMRNLEIAASRRHIQLPGGEGGHHGQSRRQLTPAGHGRGASAMSADGSMQSPGGRGRAPMLANTKPVQMGGSPMAGGTPLQANPMGQRGGADAASARSIHIDNPLHGSPPPGTLGAMAAGAGHDDTGVVAGTMQAIKGTMLGQTVTEEGVKEYQHSEAVRARNVAQRLLRRGASMRKVGTMDTQKARGDAYGYGYGGQAVPLQGQGAAGAAGASGAAAAAMTSERAAAAAMGSMHGPKPSRAGRRLQTAGSGRRMPPGARGGISLSELGDAKGEGKAAAGGDPTLRAYSGAMPVEEGSEAERKAQAAAIGMGTPT